MQTLEDTIKVLEEKAATEADNFVTGALITNRLA